MNSYYGDENKSPLLTTKIPVRKKISQAIAPAIIALMFIMIGITIGDLATNSNKETVITTSHNANTHTIVVANTLIEKLPDMRNAFKENVEKRFRITGTIEDFRLISVGNTDTYVAVLFCATEGNYKFSYVTLFSRLSDIQDEAEQYSVPSDSTVEIATDGTYFVFPKG